VLDVTVVIPTRDRPELLAVTLHSVMWQRDVDLKVVVIDDGSRTDPRDHVESLADPRVHVITHPSSLGVARARNRGIEIAKSRWIAFLDDDDVWAPEKLALQIAECESSGRDWCYTGAVDVSPDLTVISAPPPIEPDEVMARMETFNPVPGGGSGVMVRSDLLRRTGGFDAQFHTFADWELWMRLGAHGPPAAVARPLVGYGIHDGGMSLDTDVTLAEARLLESTSGRRIDMGAVHRHVMGICLRSGRRAAAVRHLFLSEMVTAEGSPMTALLRVTRRIATFARHSLDRPAAPESWVTEAELWLARLAETVASRP
jgi:GT2 family glycosyltransferase